MRSKFSTDFGNRLAQARIRVEDEDSKFNNALTIFEGETRALTRQLKQLRAYCDQLKRKGITPKEDSKFDRYAKLLKRCSESWRRTERRLPVLLKRVPIILKLMFTVERIEAFNTIADEVSVQRMETENASDETDEGWKISSEILAGESSKEELGKVKKSSQAWDFTERFEKLSQRFQELDILAGESSEAKLGGVKKSSLALDFTERVEKLSLLFEELDILAGEISEEKLGEVKKYSQALDFAERIDISQMFQKLEELFGELEMAKNEFPEL